MATVFAVLALLVAVPIGVFLGVVFLYVFVGLPTVAALILVHEILFFLFEKNDD